MKVLPIDFVNRAAVIAKARIQDEQDREIFRHVAKMTELWEEGVLIVGEENAEDNGHVSE